MMKVIRLNKSDYRDLLKFYRRIGAIDKDGKQALVDRVFMSAKDCELFSEEYARQLKKEKPYLLKKKCEESASWYMFSYGPNQSLEDLLEPGWALFVDRIEEREEREEYEE
jgi:hypothetical protein